MTQEEKQLLLKDLCARLPYHPTVKIYNDSWEGCKKGEFDNTLGFHHVEAFLCDRIEILPYLRPMRSMTEKEQEAYCNLQDIFLCSSQYPVTDAYELFEWLSEHHFDYHNLIEKILI